MALTDKLNAIGREVMTLSGSNDKVTLDQMAAHTKEANQEVDTQEELIQQITEALRGKVAPGATEDLDDVLTEQEATIAELKAILAKKASGSAETVPAATSLIRKGIGYIDTGIDADNSNLTIEVQYELETEPEGYWYLIRAYVNESTNATRILYNKTSTAYICLNSIPSSSLSVTQTRYTGVVYTDILKPEDSSNFSYTTNGVKNTKTRANGTTLTGKNLLLFNDSTTNDGVTSKVYYLKIYDGDTLVRDFVPYITSGGVCGLYDNVTKLFYGNAGSGTFEAETMNVDVEGIEEPILPQEKTLNLDENCTVEVIPDEGCVLSKVAVNVNVTSLEDLLTNKMTALNSDATSIRQYAFRGATALVSINLPNTTSIATNAFYGCTKLVSVNLPKAKTIASNTFNGCSILPSIVLPAMTTGAEYMFRYCYKMLTIDLHVLTNIVANMFTDCRAMTAVILRSPTMCTLAATSAFSNCYHFHGTANSQYNPDGLKDGYIYVPKALIEDYKAATNWSTFASQFRAIEDYPEITGG